MNKENDSDISSPDHSKSYKIKAGLFLFAAGGIGLLSGFSTALAQTKKQDTQSFDQGLVGQLTPKERQQRMLHESGARLAARALGYGTLYAVGGFGVLCYR